MLIILMSPIIIIAWDEEQPLQLYPDTYSEDSSVIVTEYY